MRERLTIPFQHFGLVNTTEDHMDMFTQHLLIKMACGFHVQACLDQARIVYNSYMASGGQQHIDPELKETILCAGVAAGGRPEWEYALEMFERTEDSQVKREMISAMACSLDIHILSSYLNSTLGENATFADRYSIAVVLEVTASDTGRALAWEFLKNNLKELRTKHKYFKCRNLATATRKFNRKVDLAEINTFWTQHCQSENRADFESEVVEPIKEKITWWKKYSPSIKSWMIKNGLIRR
ncbi:unnamed protein product [Candidula unifasciata]|uniref:ERAP1-like C-terminal domain-containing protein n=1 Tax=Candidula unifasciata TaxID=100452 RepID=A0A8S3ZL47_9EUPU|nr:unnamed protein product [Candidula unifasciata]